MKKQDLNRFFAAQDELRRLFAVYGDSKIFSEYMSLDLKITDLVKELIEEKK